LQQFHKTVADISLSPFD